MHAFGSQRNISIYFWWNKSHVKSLPPDLRWRQDHHQGKRFGFSLEEIRQLLDLYKSDQDPQIQIKQAHERAERQLKALEAKKQELEEIIDDLRSQLAWGKNLLSTRAPLKPAIRHFDQ